MSLSISLLSTSESKIKGPSACMPSLVGRSGSNCVVKRQKSIHNARRFDTEDVLLPCHPRRDQLRFYRSRRGERCSLERVPYHRLVVRGDRGVNPTPVSYGNYGAYIGQFLRHFKKMGRGTEPRPNCGPTQQYVDSPQTVTPTPVMLRGVSSSPNSRADVLIVATSFAIPAIDIGTTPTRCIILQCIMLTMGPTNANRN